MRTHQLIIDLDLRGGELITAVSTRGERYGPMRSTQRRSIDWQEIRCRVDRLQEAIRNANHRGQMIAEEVRSLRQLGAILFDQLFDSDIKALLRNSAGGSLSLGLCERLLGFPWELLHDGRQFLGEKWAVGRTILSENANFDTNSRELASPLSALVLADPAGDLPEAYNEGVALRHVLELQTDLDLTFVSTRVARRFVQESLREHDIVHFAGHIDAAGLKLLDGPFGLDDLRELSGGLAMPALVFLNGCGESSSSEFGTQDCLVTGLIRAGVRHCVAALYELPDELARDFALAFYRALCAGSTVGEGIRLARIELTERCGTGTISWGPYALYGDPEIRYVTGSADRDLVEFEAPKQAFVQPGLEQPRLRRTATAGSLSGQSRIFHSAILQAFAITVVPLLAIVAFMWLAGSSDERPSRTPSNTNGAVAPIALSDDFSPIRYELWSSRDSVSGFASERPIYDGDELQVSDLLHLNVEVRKAAYLYILLVAQDRVELLEPTESALADLCLQGVHRVPDSGGWSPQNGGYHTLVIATKDSEWPGLENSLAHLNDLLAVDPVELNGSPRSDLLHRHQQATELVTNYLDRHESRVEALTFVVHNPPN